MAIDDIVPQGLSQEYVLDEAIITSDRLGDEEIEITFQIGEINIYESLDKPYLTGTVAVLDDNAIFTNAVEFKGTERLKIKVSSVVSDSSIYTFEHTFIMTEIVKSEKINDKAEIYVISLIDVHAFYDATIKLSKSYTGKIEDIVTAIVVSELDLAVDLSYSTKSAQKQIKVIVPYMSPLHACKWLLDRATTENGSPYWLHASIYDSRLRISSFDGIYTQTPFNLNLPYLYSSALSSSVTGLPADIQSSMIKQVRSLNIENTLDLLNSGAIGSSLSYTDIFNNRTITSKHKVRNTLDRLKQNEIIPSNSEQNVFDDKFIVEENANSTKFLDDYDSRVIHGITSFGTYCIFNSYHDVFNRAQVGDKQRNISIRNLLERNTIDITVSGLALFLGKVTVGDMIRVNFLTSDVKLDNINDESSFDLSKSGDYMIQKTRHVFKQTEHNVTLTITKLNKLQYGNII